MFRLLIAGSLCATLVCLPSSAETEEGTTSRAELEEFLNTQASSMLQIRKSVVAEITTPKQAEARQAEVRGKLLSLIGTPGHGIPLNSRITGESEEDGFHIENIQYDAQPGRHVTANLFIPKGSEGPWPAVIISPGHGPSGKLGNYSFAANLARNGIVALSYDIVGEGERLEYFDPQTGRSLGERPTGDHSLAAFPAILAGETVARYFIEDAMQGIDYLQSRGDVDGQRIGAFGCSGGGTVTAYLAALDERVRAAATACYFTDYAHLLTGAGPQEGEQSIPGFISAGLDIPDWLELAAPKPYAVLSTTEDMFPFAGASAAVSEAQKIWRAYDAEDKLEWFTGPGGHGAIGPMGDRIVDFFRRSLEVEAPEAVPFSFLNPTDPAALQVTETGQLATSGGSVTLADLTRERVEATRPDASLPLEALKAAIVDLAGVRRLPGADVHVRKVSETRAGSLEFQTFEMASGMGPLDLRVIRSGRKTEAPVLLVLDPAPMHELAAPDGPLAGLASDGWTVVALQARGFDGEGEAKSAFVGDQNLLALRAMLVGHTLSGIRIGDATSAMDWIDQELNGRAVTVLGVGVMGPVALQTALLDPRIAGVRIEGSAVSLRSAASVPIARELPANTVPGMLSAYDLPDVMAALSPRPLTVAAPVDPLGRPLSEAAFRQLVPEAPDQSFTLETLIPPDPEDRSAAQ